METYMYNIYKLSLMRIAIAKLDLSRTKKEDNISCGSVFSLLVILKTLRSSGSSSRLCSPYGLPFITILSSYFFSNISQCLWLLSGWVSRFFFFFLFLCCIRGPSKYPCLVPFCALVGRGHLVYV